MGQELFAQGYNEGMAKAARSFQTMITYLLAAYAIRIIVPPIQNYFNHPLKYELIPAGQTDNRFLKKGLTIDWLQMIYFSADILSFFITLIIFYAATGRPIVK